MILCFQLQAQKSVWILGAGMAPCTPNGLIMGDANVSFAGIRVGYQDEKSGRIFGIAGHEIHRDSIIFGPRALNEGYSFLSTGNVNITWFRTGETEMSALFNARKNTNLLLELYQPHFGEGNNVLHESLTGIANRAVFNIVRNGTVSAATFSGKAKEAEPGTAPFYMAGVYPKPAFTKLYFDVKDVDAEWIKNGGQKNDTVGGKGAIMMFSMEKGSNVELIFKMRDKPIHEFGVQPGAVDMNLFSSREIYESNKLEAKGWRSNSINEMLNNSHWLKHWDTENKSITFRHEGSSVLPFLAAGSDETAYVSKMLIHPVRKGYEALFVTWKTYLKTGDKRLVEKYLDAHAPDFKNKNVQEYFEAENIALQNLAAGLLSLEILSKMALVLNHDSLSKDFHRKYNALKLKINEILWQKGKQMYANGTGNFKQQNAGLFGISLALSAGLPDKEMAGQMAKNMSRQIKSCIYCPVDDGKSEHQAVTDSEKAYWMAQGLNRYGYYLCASKFAAHAAKCHGQFMRNNKTCNLSDSSAAWPCIYGLVFFESMFDVDYYSDKLSYSFGNMTVKDRVEVRNIKIRNAFYDVIQDKKSLKLYKNMGLLIDVTGGRAAVSEFTHIPLFTSFKIACHSKVTVHLPFDGVDFTLKKGKYNIYLEEGEVNVEEMPY